MREASSAPAARGPTIVGWDIGGAHVKAARWRHGMAIDAMQWPCRLWQGMAQLDAVLAAAAARWPDLHEHAHAVTMTGEMVDLFEHREDGVRRLAAWLASALPAPRFFAGDAGWCEASDAGALWEHIASANWLATARHAAGHVARQSEKQLAAGDGMLIDIGSTTTDLIAFRRGKVLTRSRSDVQRLAHSELVYHGVVRTPLCALARRIPWRGVPLNVMNEFFATTADVYRLTGELDAAHDQHPSADNAAKDAAHSRARLARMIGLDARHGRDDEWLAFARAWRQAQVTELRGQLAAVIAEHRLGPTTSAVSAGCGAFLVPDLLPDGWRCVRYSGEVARAAADADTAVAGWVQVGAPAVAVAALYAQECG
jgi:(4-(4-[2-(gamma-L-glutamylamino)ethyl]phenoxymethyl)furan-2-yl)methanamine synthase